MRTTLSVTQNDNRFFEVVGCDLLPFCRNLNTVPSISRVANNVSWLGSEHSVLTRLVATSVLTSNSERVSLEISMIFSRENSH